MDVILFMARIALLCYAMRRKRRVTAPFGRNDMKKILATLVAPLLLFPAAAQAQFSSLIQKSEQWEQITLISAGITLGIYLWHLFDAWFFEGNYVELTKSTAMDFHNSDKALGAHIRISSDRDPVSLQIGIAF